MVGTKAKMDVQTWYLKTSKLALALAIIHSKPADRSSRQYAEQLAALVTQQESKQKSKVEALEAEVLQLRQKLFLSRISSGLFKNGEYVNHFSVILNLLYHSYLEIYYNVENFLKL